MSCKYCGKEGDLIKCFTCKGSSHASCLELPEEIVPTVKTYDWQCNDCKYCSECKSIENEEKILFCDSCDRGFHTYCVKPKVKRKPRGKWYCKFCKASEKIKLDKKEISNEEISSEKTAIEPLPEPSPPPPPPSRPCPFIGCNVKNEESKKTPSPGSSEKKANDNSSFGGRKENAFEQTPIENIVSRTDIEMFEQAKKRADEIRNLDQEMKPCIDGLKSIIFGNAEIDIWYKTQYSLEFSRQPKLYICEFCLEYMKTSTVYERHMAKCTLRHPPGDEIYRKDNLSVFEVDGAKATVYCQNLCLMAKCFLDHKTLWLDVAPFLFYIMTLSDEGGCHIIGYFSKEKVSFLHYNVSCILVLPQHMKKGYGRMLIDFSYLLSSVEGKPGSPERPLSDMGLISYRKFWVEKLLNYLIVYDEPQITVKGMSEELAINTNDIISTLQFLGMLKYWKGKHLILLKKELIEEYSSKLKQRTEDFKEIDKNCLTWKPAVNN